eukprot:764499-Hanusia_phi.AAC.3
MPLNDVANRAMGVSPEHPLGTSTDAKELIANLNHIRQMKCTPSRSHASRDTRALASNDNSVSKSAFDAMNAITGFIYGARDESSFQKRLTFSSPQPQQSKNLRISESNESGGLRPSSSHAHRSKVIECSTPAKSLSSQHPSWQTPSEGGSSRVKADAQLSSSSGFLSAFFQSRTLTFLESWPFQRKDNKDQTNLESAIKLAQEQARHDLNTLGDELQSLVSQMEYELQEERYIATQKEACLQMISKRFFSLLDLYQKKHSVHSAQKQLIVCFNLWVRQNQQNQITYRMCSQWGHFAMARAKLHKTQVRQSWVDRHRKELCAKRNGDCLIAAGPVPEALHEPMELEQILTTGLVQSDFNVISSSDSPRYVIHTA